ncbi:MAG: YHYH domain-containing protein [bacterium]|nr:YHYH domain-containing protein [bacterium]
MKKVMKRFCIFFIISLLFTTTAPLPQLSITSEAHSGRTDSHGGHKDNKNKSGLGSYHYHCGGHPAHLHENGVCPYAATTSVTTSTTPKSTSQAMADTQKETAADQSETYDYSLVFDATCYADKNADLYEAYQYDKDKLFEHFVSCGMKEGRIANDTFDVSVYKDKNPDLADVFGDDWVLYYQHYMTTGHCENRTCHAE